jgi:uridine kinase
MTTITQIKKRSGEVVDFKTERIANAIYRAAVSVGGRDKQQSEQLAGEVVQYLETQVKPGTIPTVEEVQDAVEKTLIENGHARVAKAYILYRDERARLRSDRATSDQHLSENIPWAKIWRVLDWAVTHDVHTIDSYNDRISRGELDAIITESEAAYHGDIENASNLILERRKDLKLVIITGPSSSGKTTTTIKVSERLKRAGIKLVSLTVDHYFFDLEMHPKDEFGDYDFETPYALDLPLVSDHINRLIAGEEVKIPFYDFKTGKRHLDHTPMRIGPDEVILIDSLHGLFPEMTHGVADERKFKLYLEPLLQMKTPTGEYIRWTDIRLMRRMLRDASFRAYHPTRTLLHWHYVRNAEMRFIIPFITTTDVIVNSAMPYELSIYQPRLIEQFAGWVEKYRNDPLQKDAFERASRTFDFLKWITPLDDPGVVPNDSVIREFIGGSIYQY